MSALNSSVFPPSVVAPPGDVFDDGLAAMREKRGAPPASGDDADPLTEQPREASHSSQDAGAPPPSHVKKLAWSALILAGALMFFVA